MLNSAKKIRLARQKKIKNIRTLVLSEKIFLNETKNHNPPFKLNGRSLIVLGGEVGLFVEDESTVILLACFTYIDIFLIY